MRQNSPRTACDVLLRQLPEAIARWRSEQPLPQGRLKEEYIKVDSETGYVEIEPMDAADAAATVGECDDVKDYGAIVANLLETSMPHAARRVRGRPRIRFHAAVYKFASSQSRKAP